MAHPNTQTPHANDSPEVLRVRCEWDRFERGDAIPCLDVDAEVVAVFEAFFQGGGAELLRGHAGGDLVVEYDRFVELLHAEIFDVEATLAQQPDRVLRQLGVAADLAIKEFLPASQKRLPTMLRLRSVVPETPLASLRSDVVDKLVSIRATVTRVGPVKPLVTEASFSCAQCFLGASDPQFAMRVRFRRGEYRAPSRCEGGECKGRKFDLLRDTAKTADVQKVRVQQQLDDAKTLDDDAGRIPRSLDVECVGCGLVDKCVPGDVVVIAGIVRVINSAVAAGRKDRRALQQATSVMYLAANSIVNASREAEAGSSQQKSEYDCQEKEEDNKEELDLVESVAQHEDPLSLVVASFAPRIYGHELVKLGLLLGLFGGTCEKAAQASKREAANYTDGTAKRKRDNDQATQSISVRSNSHVLVVGDPGLGKSQMLRAAASVAPRAVYVCGNTTTTTGLTVSLTREGKSGAPALEAGAVVLGDRGACCIDEFDKMDAGQHAGLLEAMEQQQISIAKAGVVATLQARTAIMAAANPAGGSYDRARTVAENVRLSAPLLSRFDLVFLLVDDPDEGRDELLSRHVLDAHRGKNAGPRPSFRRRSSGCSPGSSMPASDAKTLEAKLREGANALDENDVLSTRELRTYCAYVRRKCHPRLDTKAAVLLQKTYLELRREASLAAPGRAMPITTRQLESLVRLAQARAKIENRSIVTEDDARDVVALMKDSVRDACTNADGNVDFTRQTSGMSAAKAVKRLRDLLHGEAERLRSPWFRLDDIIEVAQKGGVQGMINELVDVLRDQSYLMHQRDDDGNWGYKLTSCRFGGGATTQGSRAGATQRSLGDRVR